MFVVFQATSFRGHWSNKTISMETAHAVAHELGVPHAVYQMHYQWAADLFAEQLNHVAEDVSILDCRSDRARMERALLLSYQSPVLAAKSLDLDECHHILSFGETALLSKCQVASVIFSAKEDQCGFQPVFGNFTISKDGKTLRLGSACYWQNGVVNFEGAPFEFKEGKWQMINPTSAVKLARLDAHVSITVDKFSVMFPDDDEAIAPLVFEMLGELQGMVAETGSDSFTEFADVTKEAVGLTWLSKLQTVLKFAAITAAVGVAVAVLVVVVWKL